MIRRSKVTSAASSSPNSSAVKDDGHETIKYDDRVASEQFHHPTNSSSDSNNHKLYQGYARLNDDRQLLTKSSTANTMTSKTPHNHLCSTTKKSIAPTRCVIIIVTIVALTVLYQLDAYIREYQGPLDLVTTTIRIPYYDMSCPSFSQYVEDSMESSSSSSNNGRSENENGIILWDCNSILQKKQSTANDGEDAKIQGESAQSAAAAESHSSSSSPPPPFPRIFMIGARDETQDTFQSWQSQLLSNDNNDATTSPPQHTADHQHNNVFSSSQPYLKRINTLEVSNQFATSGGALLRQSSNTTFSPPRLRLSTTFSTKTTTTPTTTTTTTTTTTPFLCRKIKWEQRLFHVYQHIFTELLTTYPNDDGFVIVEDDATLLNPMALAEEVCNAHDDRQKIQFYSLYRSPLQQRRRMHQWWRASSSSSYSCVYQHGTVAFYIRRQLMQQIINEHRRSYFCRFPIDMYISKFGPWYATRNEVVGHLGSGRIGSS